MTKTITAALQADPVMKPFAIEVSTTKGVVKLTGRVDTAAQVKIAGKIAQSVEGVQAVENNLVLK